MNQIQPWAADRLSFARVGQTYTHLVQSITDSKVITIEAGFGHGKTFFRKAWAQELSAAGEVVIEIDAQQSDHSGEPVVTFLGALLAERGTSGKTVMATLKEKGLNLAGIVGRGIARAVLSKGAEEIIEKVGDLLERYVEGQKALKETLEEAEAGLSTYAGQLIATQLVTEHARQTELPAQIRAIRDALTEGKAAKRVVVLIDELDRCRPDYAIALLEAMKLVFNEDGFVFVLLVNAEYLNDIADHRYGTGKICKNDTEKTSEKYMEKFVDFRLKLRAPPEALAEATRELVAKIELAIPFGDDPAFSVMAAADLAAKIAPESGLSFRQIKRVVERVDLVARCYRHRPIDLPLLTLLAFVASKGDKHSASHFYNRFLSRAVFTPEAATTYFQQMTRVWDAARCAEVMDALQAKHPELLSLCGVSAVASEAFHAQAEVVRQMFQGLAPHYIPDHEAMLDAVHQLMVD